MLGSLLARGLIQEVSASAKHAVWRKAENGTALSLKVTRAGCAAIGIERSAGRAKTAEPGARPERAGTKQAQVIAMLSGRREQPSSRSWRRPGGSPTRSGAPWRAR